MKVHPFLANILALIPFSFQAFFLLLLIVLVLGVKAVLVRKDNKPKWNPTKIENVTDESIAHFFKPFADGDSLPM